MYIGRTHNLKHRLKQHSELKGSSTELIKWLAELSLIGQNPIMVVLHTEIPREEIDLLEINTIKEYSNKHKLLNKRHNPNQTIYMNRTFYVPKGKEEAMRRFVEICEAQEINYSTLLNKWIELYNEENKTVKPKK